MPPAIFTLALSLLHVAVYAEAVVILVLLIAIGFVWFQGALWMRDCEQAETERNEARRTLDALHRVSEIRADTVNRLRGYGR